MKHVLNSMFALVAGAMALSACSSDEILENENNQPIAGNMTFTATVSDDEGDTRTALDGLNVVWSAGDEISVFSDANYRTNNKFTLASSAGTTNASFTGECAKGSNYYAVFPYHKNNEYYLDGLLIVWEGREQTAVKGSFDPSVPMLAKTTEVSEEATTVPLNFKNLLSFVKVTTDYKCKSITLTSKNSSRYLSSAGQYIMFDADGNPYIKSYENYSNSVTLKGKDGANIEGGTYYIAVFPGTLDEGFDLTFTAVNGTDTYTKSTDKSVTLKRSKVLNLGNFVLQGTAIETLEGKGTSEEPYKIQDLEDLITFQRWITSEKGETYKKTYLQTADIDAHGSKMAPIGTADHRFWGRYDGGNHYIKNLCIEGSFEYQTGVTSTRKATALFGAIKDATICNLTIENPSFSFGQNNSSNFCTGSPFVGVAYSADAAFESSRCKILNCHLKGDCTINTPTSGSWTSFCYGGFVGESMSNLEITDCTTEMELSITNNRAIDDSWIGGFVGVAYGVNETNSSSLERDGYLRINRCRNNSQALTFNESAAVEKLCLGGFIGAAFDGTLDDIACKIYNSVNNAAILLENEHGYGKKVYIGGFMGLNDSDGYGDVDPTIENCINNGFHKNTAPYESEITIEMGGINGHNYDDDTKFTNCANTADLTVGVKYSHPKAISYSNGTFTYCYNGCWIGYDICNNPQDSQMKTNCGDQSISTIVSIMNETPSVTSDPNNFFYRWKAITLNGYDALDLEY